MHLYWLQSYKTALGVYIFVSIINYVVSFSVPNALAAIELLFSLRYGFGEKPGTCLILRRYAFSFAAVTVFFSGRRRFSRTCIAFPATNGTRIHSSLFETRLKNVSRRSSCSENTEKTIGIYEKPERFTAVVLMDFFTGHH